MSVAVYLTNRKPEEAKKLSNVNGKADGEILDAVIVKAGTAGAYVVVYVTAVIWDQTIWPFRRIKGITGGRKHASVISSFPNLAYENSTVFVLSDPVHLMKSIKSMMGNNETIILPDDIVKEEGLESATVDYKHIKDLYQYESQGRTGTKRAQAVGAPRGPSFWPVPYYYGIIIKSDGHIG